MRKSCGCWPWSRRRAYAKVLVDEQRVTVAEPYKDEDEAIPRPSVPVRYLQRVELCNDVTHQTAIAFDALNNRMAVSNTDSNSVDVLDVKTGACTHRFGGRGTDPGQFWSPSSLVFDTTGRDTLLVGERNGAGRVQDMHIQSKVCLRAYAVEGGVSALDANRIVVAVGCVRAAPDGTTVVLLCAQAFMPLRRIGALNIHGLPVLSCAAVALDVGGQTRVWVSESAGARAYACSACTFDGRVLETLPHDALVTQLAFLSPTALVLADSGTAGLHMFFRTCPRSALKLYTSLYAPQLGLAAVFSPVFICNSQTRPDVLWVSDAGYTRHRCLAMHELRFPENGIK